MSFRVLLITPAFTQLNTPYPATCYLKGFLNTRNIACSHADLGLETTLMIFCRQGLEELFANAAAIERQLSANDHRIAILKEDYINSIDAVIAFLQGKNPTLAPLICGRSFLPEASRFAQAKDSEWAFGQMSVQDKARFLCTMYLEDLSDFIQETVDPDFGFSRYAESIARSANSFDEIYETLQQPPSFTHNILFQLLAQKMRQVQPALVGFSVPFPGNLLSALRCAQWIKAHFPAVKTVMGGGFANTELRSLTDKRVFEFFDFITLDDGEAPLEILCNFLQGKVQLHELKRTFTLVDGHLQYINNSLKKDYRQGEVGTPDYSDLLLDEYISAIEVMNPMHRLWTDGRWNKLTMAHGCYWGKCTFCDVSLDYIRLYEPVAASLICDRMQQLIDQTGEHGFHFVDEAAPPALMRALALEIIKRKMIVTWWANIRFEKSFTRDLCLLLKASGCIAVSGGLEVAADRLLQLIEKGITVEQVARVNKHFTEAGIMVHAYLMYGYPTQTAQETIDSLEMVRQMFKAGVMQSAYWHRFALTAHSPVGLNPEKYKIKILNTAPGSFANNDLEYEDLSGTDHDAFGFGLKKSLFNYMHQLGLEEPLHKWFDFKVPKTSIAHNFIESIVSNEAFAPFREDKKVVWLGNLPQAKYHTQSKKGRQREMATLHFISKRDTLQIQIPKPQSEWLLQVLPGLAPAKMPLTLQQLRESYEAAGLEDFEMFWDTKPMNTMYKAGLLTL